MKKRVLCMILCMILSFSNALVALASSVPTEQTAAETEQTVTETEQTATGDVQTVTEAEQTAAESVQTAAESVETAAESVQTAAEDTETEGLNVTGHTQEEIRAFCTANPADLSQAVTYEEGSEPSLSEPYKAGVLSDETQQSALNLINQCRYIAGLDADVALDEAYSEQASAATFLNALNDKLSHYPVRPDVLADSQYDTLYGNGRTGAQKSNIAAGYGSLNKAIIEGWMSDADDSNISRVGHRRWVLNPTMSKIGFGMTENSVSVYKYYYAMYAHDSNGSGTQTRVAWPAQNMPIQYFNNGDPWFVSFGKELTADAIQVKIVRISDNTEWSFSSADSDGEFYVENSYYGQRGCVIFRPDTLTEVAAGDCFQVTISGVETVDISYQVTFFDLEASGDNTGDSGSTEDSGIQEVESGTCGENITWTYRSDGDLIISGSGKMNDYTTTSSVSEGITTDVPWGSYLSSIKRVVFEGSVTYIGKCAFSDCTNLSEIIWPDTLEQIGTQGFIRCDSLTEVTVPDGVTTIGTNAFRGCDGLQKITLPDSAVTLGNDMFYGCGQLSEVHLPEGLKYIPYTMFAQCTSLKTIDLPDSLETIYSEAFVGCSALQEIEIPHSVQYIGTYAFQSCTSLNSIYVYAKMPEFGTNSSTNIFPNRSTCTIYCYKNSTMEAYLKYMGYTSVCSYITEDDDKEILAEVSGYHGVYDGEEHFISIEVTNVPEGSYEIYYSPYEVIYPLYTSDGYTTWFPPMERSEFTVGSDA